MPAKGKHRRPKPKRLTRSIAAAGTGGAALALPLMGATGAHASTASESVSQKTAVAAQTTAASEKAAAEKSAKAEKKATAKSGKRTYAVKRGDYLARIAEEQDVTGGWQRIYADNRKAIGSDPSLIHPGLRLTLGGKAAPASTADRTALKARSSAEKVRETPRPQKTEQAAPSTPKPQAPAQKQAAPAAQSAGGFSLPVAGASVGTSYRTAGSMWSSGYHTGVDFVVPTGTSLKAVGSGTVVSAGWGGAYGNQVVIRLADGHYAQYAHLSSLSVSVGQSVSAGTQVGLSGATGNVTGPHLHFEIRSGAGYGSDIDPVAYLRSKGLSL